MTSSPIVQPWLCVIGTRPEAIKMAMIAQQAPHIQVVLTGQHTDMVANILQDFNVVPQHVLLPLPAQRDLCTLTAHVLQHMGALIAQVNPAVVLVQGDTASAAAAGWAAFLQHVPVAHIEAGLRTHNKMSPWPEEMNRVLLAQLATYHFAPTPLAADNLKREGIAEQNIVVTGNTGIDALLYAVSLPLRDIDLPFSADKKLILVTGHRRENLHGTGLADVVAAIQHIAQRRDVSVVWPVHPNPLVMQAIAPLQQCANVHLINPVDYVPFVQLMQRAYLIISDSGGIQEEAPSLGIPVLITREDTERPEAVEAGSNILVGTDPDVLVKTVHLMCEDTVTYGKYANVRHIYGDGTASQKIVTYLAANTRALL